MCVQVTDNGLGFDSDGDFPGHLGLRSMSKRIEKLGGSRTICFSPGSGATIRAEARLWPKQQKSRS